MSQSDKQAFLILSFLQTLVKTTKIYDADNECINNLVVRAMNEYVRHINNVSKEEINEFEIRLAQIFVKLTELKFIIHEDLVSKLLIYYSEIFLNYVKGNKMDAWLNIKTFGISHINLQKDCSIDEIVEIIYKHTKIGKNEKVQ